MPIDHPPLPPDDAPFDHDNPEWTEEMFARAKPLSAFPELADALLVRKPGRPVGTTTSDRQQVTLRIPRSAIERLKAGGAIIVIATHRVSLINVADTLAILKDGRLERFGARQDILKPAPRPLRPVTPALEGEHP